MSFSSDPMRRKYRDLDTSEKVLLETVKSKGEELYRVLGNLGESREISIAKTKLEECVMWASKHLTAPR